MDGNGQLFLAVQDINMDGFLKQLDGVNKLAKNQRRERVLIIFSDEEWDVKNLANAFGSGKETVIKKIRKYRVYKKNLKI